ncbi:hypothetical protein [Pseudoalteromonas sp. HM-SA03]|uniref:hypothetical protein n=1 Tax=Pseudoalteromonas sp. HM-SA03 TaxID=2029678 RepID=UPI0020D191CF|nr:hypothetical protein [Pseudoalteromonas sp. HM-SA03]
MITINGFDVLSVTPHSVHFTTTQGLGSNNHIHLGDMRDGMPSVVDSIGFEANFNLGNDWQIEYLRHIYVTFRAEVAHI